MRTRTIGLLAAGLAFLAASPLVAGDEKPKGGGATAARSTAEVGFAEIRKAATDKDEVTLTKRIPVALVKDWSEEAAGDGKKWRADFAANIAAGTVVSVKEDKDDAVARWKTDKAVWETRLRYADGQWTLASPWAYLVGGAEFDKMNGRAPARLKLRARTSPTAYGPSAFSFVNVTQDPKQCLNRMDLVFCRCGQMHAMHHAMISVMNGKKLAEIEGLPGGMSRQDEIVPKSGAVYLLHLQAPGHNDFVVAMEITSKTDSALEIDWRIVAAGKNAPASIRAPQPLVSNDGTDGTATLCDKPEK